MSKYHGLIIDDDPISLELLLNVVTDMDSISCTTFANGVDAYTYLQNIKSTEIDVVICDWKMPLINGLELYTHFRKLFKEIPFLLVTSEINSEVLEYAKNVGIDDVVAKPFKSSNLQQRIRRLLEYSASKA
ncbi:response regulator [Aliiglaciecola sp. LCG003]|uniref:response regulator n=1 Tax=Aliiglaciecola sp. LCG003 TaxID=3053655 RepID=UPI002573C948|nr:response regulator [Aliiglaciecola sp. LCG003]WJG08711.1 response regulator [Aliiglaciecola sp. LCG003]